MAKWPSALKKKKLVHVFFYSMKEKKLECWIYLPLGGVGG